MRDSGAKAGLSGGLRAAGCRIDSAVNAPARVVRGACPHDCPDTCALLVEVDASGRATSIKGAPEHPVTAGFLCGKVSNYLERVYSEERVLHPLVRTGAKGEGRFRQVGWDEALDTAAAGLREAAERHGGASIVPYSYLGTQGVLQGDVMGNRLMDALGGSTLVRTICASAGAAGTVATNGASPEVDPEEWVHARTIVVWGWNPLSTAPHLWRFILEARKRGARLIVIDPFRSRTARVADWHLQPLPGSDGALALGVMRALVDAGLADAEWCEAHTLGYGELLTRLQEGPVELQAQRCGLPDEDVRELARALAQDQPSLIRLGVGAQRHAGAPIAYRTIACIPALTGSWRHRGGGLSYIPTAMFGVLDDARLARPQLREGPARSLNMSSIGEALTDAALDPPVAALVVWNSNPAAIAPDQEKVLAGLRRDDLFTIVCEQFMTDTAAHADVVFPATTQLEHLDIVWSWGHHYITLNEPAIAPLGEARPNSETFRLLAHRLGLTDPCFDESDEQMLAALLDGDPAGIGLAACASAASRRSTAGRAPTARRGRVRHPVRQARAALRAARRRRLRSAAVLRPTRRGRGRGARRALSACPADAEDPPLPQLHVREPAAAACRPARPVRRHPPRRCGGPRHRRRRGCASRQRARQLHLPRRGLGRRPRRRAQWRRWAGGTGTTRVAAARRRRRRSASRRCATHRRSTTTAWRSRPASTPG